jgi:hypothetical protein
MGKKENQHRWYEKNKAVHYANIRARKLAMRAENREKLLAYLREHPCVDCGETDPDMLTFDHVRGKKRKEVTTLAKDGYGWATVEAEIAKCVVRCWNHHMKRTRELQRARNSTGRVADS